MKFSIIVPVYNVEKYISKCLESIKNQKYNNYEVIIINDGSQDNSQKIINSFTKDDLRFKSYIKKNGGLSDARNYGIKKVTGDYLLFLDSDDYISSDLLFELNKVAVTNYDVDLIKYGCQLVDTMGNITYKYITKDLKNCDKINSLKSIVTDDMVESACIYAYRKDFFLKNDFKYALGKYHEDFGLTPYIILLANQIISIEYIGLNYVQREGSIINCSDKVKNRKKAFDFLDLYIDEISKINELNISKDEKDIIKIFMTDSVVRKLNSLSNDIKKDYKNKLKENKIYRNVPSNSIKRFIKKMCLYVNCDLYLTIATRKK